MKRLEDYEGVVYQTENTKILLRFHDGSEAWQGMYPGCSFDHYYDDVMSDLGPDEVDELILLQRQFFPTIVYPFKDVGVCQRPECDKQTQYKYCSLNCWYLNGVETSKYAVDTAITEYDLECALDFYRKLTSRYGCYAVTENVAKS